MFRPKQARTPILAFLGDGVARKRAEIHEAMARRFSLSPEEREELIPSGKATRLSKACGWALYGLVQDGLVFRPSRGIQKITNKGRQFLNGSKEEVE